ncbi:MAG: UDP-3-O-acyl-N-acetylglucosamine deacetylase [Rickettsiales bacterium]|jgi:UDP-3-O-[3-hydroxymyristoyl] N-acetylglucosamine deacetylase|nr:UDP-3-O-acyl-N-acetylglucosamine deacetylase [Rickettsiales bacterium]
MLQRTLGNSLSIQGIGLHSGREATIELSPAESGGIVFRPKARPSLELAGSYRNVQSTNLGTTIGFEDGQMRVLTIEHLMAAIWACDLDNLLIELEGEEIPALDGSSRCFMDKISSSGVTELPASREVLRIRKGVVAGDQSGSIAIEPADGFSIDMTVSFDYGNIGAQHYFFDGSRETFRRELAGARTFCSSRDIEAMREAGLALGGSLENALVFGDGGILNPRLILQEREVVKHKVLDCLGDLRSSGYSDLRGALVAQRSGHRLNNELLRKIFSDESNYTIE